MSLWENYSDDAPGKKNDRPIWAIGKDEDAIHEWLENEYCTLLEDSKERFQTIQRNYALYRGVQYLSQETRNDIRDVSQDRARTSQKVVFNDYYDLTQNKVARLIKYRPAVSILPTNDDFSDKIAASTTQKTLSNLWYNTNFEGDLQPWFVKLVKLSGEAYFFIEWDKDLGPLHPQYAKFKEKYGAELRKFGKTPLLDENGSVEKDDEGKEIYIHEEIHVGDVRLSSKMPLEVLIQKAPHWLQSKYLFVTEPMNVYEARLKYPEYAENIEEEEFDIYDYSSFETRKSEGEVLIKTFYHKKCRECPEGFKIIFTSKGCLYKGKNPYDHGMLPCVRMTDIDRPGELHASSFIEIVKGLIGARNNIMNMALKQIIMGAHPKWKFPAGSVKKESLGNDFTLVEYKGPIAPSLEKSDPIAPSMLAFAESLKQESQQKSGVFGVSQGEPPTGVTAAVALQFLSEQENERMNEDVLKYNEWIRQVAVMCISVMSQYYRKDDGRLLQILGKGNEWQVEMVDTSALTKSFDVRVQNSSALPQSKAARLQYILDLRKEFPNIITDEQTLDLLEFAQNDKFVDLGTVSIKAAEAENEQILQDKEVDEPEQFEDHLGHWITHAKTIRAWSFKNKTPEVIRKRLEEHQLVHEMFMSQMAASDPAFMPKLAELKGFPMFFAVPGPSSMIEPPLPPAPMDLGGMPSGMPGGMESYSVPEAETTPQMPPITPPQPPVGDMNVPSMAAQPAPIQPPLA